MATAIQNSEIQAMTSEGLGALPLSVVLIGPEAGRRGDVARGLTAANAKLLPEWTQYPEIDQLQQVLDLQADIVIVDLDSAPEYALEVVESLCAAASQATVMVYSSGSDTDLMVRCMRAGAREFLTLPISQNDLAEAMVRASARRSSRTGKKSDGVLSVFWGAKGGSGVTTLATSFAVSTAQDLKRKTLLIDLDLPLGDAALQLGLNTPYSTVDALANYSRLDGNFLSRLIVKHSSGLWVLAAPGKFAPPNYSIDAVNKLVQVARTQFDSVVVDSGSRMELMGTSLFEGDSNMYLTSQVGIAELRNSNRMVTELFNGNPSRLQVVLNRFSTSMMSVDEQHITKALTVAAQWRIPEETAAARKMQDTATPLALHNTAIARVIEQMTRAGAGLPPATEKKKKFIGLF